MSLLLFSFSSFFLKTDKFSSLSRFFLLFFPKSPSNPTGSNWSEAHLRQIAAVASKHRIPVIADEVYAGMAWSVSDTTTSLKPEGEITQGKFNRGVFTPFASVSGDVPVLVTGAISKRLVNNLSLILKHLELVY